MRKRTVAKFDMSHYRCANPKQVSPREINVPANIFATLGLYCGLRASAG
jgi:hypothetical protein